MPRPLYPNRETKPGRRPDRLVRFPKVKEGGEGSGTIRWGIVQGHGIGGVDWANVPATERRAVTIIETTWEGDYISSEMIWAYTCISPGKDTALWGGSLVGFHTEPDGTNIIITDHVDDPIGTMRVVNTPNAVRRLPGGWVEADETDDLFVKGRKKNFPPDDYGQTGGHADHTHEPHFDHDWSTLPMCREYITNFEYVVTWLDGTHGGPLVNHSTENSIPPWIAYQWIKRIN